MRTLLRKTVDGLAQDRRESGSKISIGFMTGIRTFLEQIIFVLQTRSSHRSFFLSTTLIHQ
jgi:hypothetical protein